MNRNIINQLYWLIGLGIILSTSCTSRLPLRIVDLGDRVEIDVQTLGEYQTTVKHIKLINIKSGVTVWELDTLVGTPQINRFELKIGMNLALIKSYGSGKYTVVIPAGKKTFLLEKDTNYEIILWGAKQSSKASGTFSLSANNKSRKK